MLFLDGVYLSHGPNPPLFHPVAGPCAIELQRLIEQVANRVGQVLEKRALIGHSITYRFAVGPRTGQKLFTLQTVPPRLQGPDVDPHGAARAGGFSLHAGLGLAASQRGTWRWAGHGD